MHFLRAQNINSFDLQIRMYMAVFINSDISIKFFFFFFFQLEIRVLDFLPLLLAPYLPSQLKMPLPLYPRVQKQQEFSQLGLLGSGSGARWWETSQARGKNVSLNVPAQLGRPTPSPSRVPTKCVRPSESVPWRCALLSFIYSILYVILLRGISLSDLAESTSGGMRRTSKLFSSHLPDLDTQG